MSAQEHDPTTRWWLQRDPIDVAGGHPNVYLYCGNEPVNLTDPDGLEWDWKRYWSDVGNVFIGYGQAILGVVSSPFTIGAYFWEHGLSWDSLSGLVSGMWQGFCADWSAAWNGDSQAFGRAFGGALITVGTAGAPFAKGGTAPSAGSGALKQVGRAAAVSESRASTALAPRLIFTKHALERMSERGITPSMVRKALERGKQYWDPKNKTINYVLENATASHKSLVVGRNPVTGEITTVYFTRRWPKRCQPIERR